MRRLGIILPSPFASTEVWQQFLVELQNQAQSDPEIQRAIQIAERELQHRQRRHESKGEAP